MDFSKMLRYCTLLEQNNNRTWFHEADNYSLYTDAKQEFTELVEELKFRIADHCAPDLAERLIFADPKGLQFRIPRDMRSNKGKPPYNPRFAAMLAADRHTFLPLGYYLHIQPGNRSVFGTGVWCQDSDMLLRIRTYLSENAERFFAVLDECGYPVLGERLKHVPRGFSTEDPAAEYLKYKDWLAERPFADGEMQSFDRFAEDIVAAVERMEPLRCFFNDAVTGRRKNPFDPADWD